MSHRVAHCEPNGLLSQGQHSNWKCSKCAKVLHSYDQVGYDGPAHNGRPDPQNIDCSPFMEWLVLCNDCARTFD